MLFSISMILPVIIACDRFHSVYNFPFYSIDLQLLAIHLDKSTIIYLRQSAHFHPHIGVTWQKCSLCGLSISPITGAMLNMFVILHCNFVNPHLRLTKVRREVGKGDKLIRVLTLANNISIAHFMWTTKD